MRLWQKISIINISILLIVVSVCSILLLFYAKSNILQLTIENAKTEQENLRISFSGMADYYLKEEMNPVVQRSAAKYCFSRFANETSVLVHKGETLYSSVSIKPEEILPLTNDNEQQVFQIVIEERNILIVGNDASLFSDKYSVYLVKDITGVYNSIIKMFWRFVLISGLSIIAGMSLIILLVRQASRPLIRLKDMTRRISVGEYGERVEISSKDEVGELAADFNTMADAVQSQIANLEDTAQRQQLFISGLTHELKTPMTSILIHSDTLLSTRLDEEKAQHSLLHIHEQCRWLEGLTQKLLKLITLEEGFSMKPEWVEDLFADVAHSTSEILEERKIPLKTECNIDTLNMDYDLMKSLLINLIHNASKASKEGRPILIRAYDNVIEVRDQGRGIPQNDISRLTDAFYMVDPSRSKAKGGSGLGLALAQKIADVHNAQIVIESEIGMGTIVRLLFPLNKTFTTS